MASVTWVLPPGVSSWSVACHGNESNLARESFSGRFACGAVGVGDTKLRRYGTDFLAVIGAHEADPPRLNNPVGVGQPDRIIKREPFMARRIFRRRAIGVVRGSDHRRMSFSRAGGLHTISVLPLLLAAAGCGSDNPGAGTVWPDVEWPVSTPEAEGVDPAAIDSLVADIDAGRYGLIDHFLLIRNGRVIARGRNVQASRGGGRREGLPCVRNVPGGRFPPTARLHVGSGGGGGLDRGNPGDGRVSTRGGGDAMSKPIRMSTPAAASSD